MATLMRFAMRVIFPKINALPIAKFAGLVLLLVCGTATAVVVPDKDHSASLSGNYEEFDFIGSYGALTLGFDYAKAILHALEKNSTRKPDVDIKSVVRAEAPSRCPKQLKLDVTKGSFALQFLLESPSDATCKRSDFLKWPATLADLGQSAVPGPIFDKGLAAADVPKYVSNDRVLYSATGKDLLGCGLIKFSQLTIYGLAQQFLTVLYAQFQQFSVPQAAVQLIFGKLNNFPALADEKLPFVWNSVYITETMLGIRQAFKALGNRQLLSLTQTEAPGGQSPECLYVKNAGHSVGPPPAVKLVDISEHGPIPGVTTATTSKDASSSAPGVTITSNGQSSSPTKATSGGSHGISPIDLAKMAELAGITLQPTKPKPVEKPVVALEDSMENLLNAMIPVIMKSVVKPFVAPVVNLQLTDSTCRGAKGDIIESLELNPATIDISASYEKAWQLPVTVNEIQCGKATASRYLEIEPIMKATELGKRGLKLLETALPILVKKLAGNPALEAYLAKKAPKKFLEELKEAIAKTLATAVRIDVSQCSFLKDRSDIGVLVADIPTADLCSGPKKPFNCKDLTSGLTGMAVREATEDSPCLYSSSPKLARAQTVTTVTGNTAPTAETKAHLLPEQKHKPEQKPKPEHGKSQLDYGSFSGASAIQTGQKPVEGQRLPGQKPKIEHGTPGGSKGKGSSTTSIVPGTGAQTGTKPPHISGAMAGGFPAVPGAHDLSKILGACFPSLAKVMTASGELVSMRNLRVGENVEVSPGVFSPVLLFTHAHPGARSRMVVLESTHGKLVASPSHYVHVNGVLVAMADVLEGDLIAVQHGDLLVHEPVLRVSTEMMMGLYNPQTAAGSVLVRIGEVEGTAPVLASTYTTAMSPPLAHLLMSPLRALHSIAGFTVPGLSGWFPDTHVEQRAAQAGTRKAWTQLAGTMVTISV